MRDREGGSPQLKIGLKYCGGCRAQYNRVKTVEYIRSRLGDDVSFVPPDRDDLDFVLIVAGCKTACVDVSPFEGHPIRYITSEEDAEQLIADLRKD